MPQGRELGCRGCCWEPKSAAPSCLAPRTLPVRPPGRNAFQVLVLLFKTSSIVSRIKSFNTCIICQHTGMHVTHDKENTCKETSANPARASDLSQCTLPTPSLWNESDPPGLTPRLPRPWGISSD